MLANVGHELLRELATGVELSKIANNASPRELPGRSIGFGRRRRIEVEGVSKGSDGFGDVASELLELLVDGDGGGRVFVVVVVVGGGSGGGSLGSVVGAHEDLLHRVVVGGGGGGGGGAAGPTF